LTPVRKALEGEHIIVRRNAAGTVWFHLRDTPQATIDARLAEQLPVYQALKDDDFKKRLGQTLEIAVLRALQSQTELPDYLGSFLDMDQHDDSILYSKEEPPRRLGNRDIR